MMSKCTKLRALDTYYCFLGSEGIGSRDFFIIHFSNFIFQCFSSSELQKIKPCSVLGKQLYILVVKSSRDVVFS